MGLRRDEPDWKRTLNDFIAENGDAIEAILLDYGVPLLDERGQPISTAPGKPEDHGELAPAPEPRGHRTAEYRAPVPDR
jgi:hypothetical protein